MPAYSVLSPTGTILDYVDHCETIVSVLKAEPGTMIGYPFEDQATHFVPVIAWGLCGDGTLVPMTMEGAWDGVEPRHQFHFVMHPDGKCQTVETCFATLEEVVAEYRASLTKG